MEIPGAADDIEYSEFDTGGGMPVEAPAPESGAVEWTPTVRPPASLENVQVPAKGAEASMEVGTVIKANPTTEIAVRPDLMQFKRIDEGESGVNAEDKLDAREWDPLKGGNLLVWEPMDPAAYGLANGERYIVANGHHRMEFAKRKGVDSVNIQVIREADGVSAEEARALAAEINIADGKGNIYDQAKFFREQAAAHGADEALERGREIGARGRKAAAIGIEAEDNLFEAFINEVVTPEEAAAIAGAAPRDAGLQALGISLAKKGRAPAQLGYDLQLAARERGAAGASDQGDLFGMDDSAIQAMAETSNRVIALEKAARERIGAVRGALKKPELARKMGVDPGDTDALQARVDALQDLVDRVKSFSTDEEILSLVGRKDFDPVEAVEQFEVRPESDEPNQGGLGLNEEAGKYGLDVMQADRLKDAKAVWEAQEAAGKRAAAKEYAAKWLRGRVVSNQYFGEIQIRQRGVKKILSNSARLSKLDVLPFLPDLLRNAEPTERSLPNSSKKAKHPAVKAYYYALSEVQLPNGEILRSSVTLEEWPDGKIVYNYEDEEGLAIKSGIQSVDLPNSPGRQALEEDSRALYGRSQGLSPEEAKRLNRLQKRVLKGGELSQAQRREMEELQRKLGQQDFDFYQPAGEDAAAQELERMRRDMRARAEKRLQGEELVTQGNLFGGDPGQMSLFEAAHRYAAVESLARGVGDPIRQKEIFDNIYEQLHEIESLRQTGRSYQTELGLGDEAHGELFARGSDPTGGAGPAAGRPPETGNLHLHRERALRGDEKALVKVLDAEGSVTNWVSKAIRGDIPAWSPAGKTVNGPADFAALRLELSNPYREIYSAAVVDVRTGKIVEAEVLNVGALDVSLVDSSALMRLVRSAARKTPLKYLKVYDAHNHPGGDVLPSSADMRIYRNRMEQVQELGLAGAEHVVTNGKTFYSLEQMRELPLAEPARFAWEVVPRHELKVISGPDGLAPIAAALRQGNRDRLFVVGLSNRMRIVAALKMPTGNILAPEFVTEVAIGR
ncbi:MAG: JAB domain-containing protein, partial [Puniceicoccales bacterium]